MYTIMAARSAGREAIVSRHRLSLVNISIYLDKFMRAGYQQAVEILNMSAMRTQEGNKARTASSKQCRWQPGAARKQSRHFCLYNGDVIVILK